MGTQLTDEERFIQADLEEYTVAEDQKVGETKAAYLLRKERERINESKKTSK